MARQLFIVALCLVLSTFLALNQNLMSAYAYGDSEDFRPHPSNVNFPPQFYVTTGTTIPFIGSDPVAQSGAIYYDEVNQRIRVDNFWLGNQRSFVVDLGKERGYVLSNGQCSVLKLTGGLKRYGVPDGAIRSLDPVSVRGVPVLHYTAVEKEETIQLVDFFVRPMNLSFVYDADDLASDYVADAEPLDDKETAERKAAAAETDAKIREDEGAFFVPWQIKSKRLRQRTIAPSAFTSTNPLPNWRFFGEPMDEIIPADEAADEFGNGPSIDGKFVPRGAVEKLVEDVTVTIDFYNFVPAQPSPSIFEMPSVCADQSPRAEFNYNVNVHQTQRLLVDMTFNSKQGRKLMDHLWRADFVKRVKASVPDSNTQKTSQQQPPSQLPSNNNNKGGDL